MPSRDRLKEVEAPVVGARVAIGATTTAFAIGGVMATTGHSVDPLTAALTASVGLAAAAVPWTLASGRRRAPRLFSEVDTRTGVGTAREALSLIDRECERARNYGAVFSLTVLELDHAMFATITPRRSHRLVRELVSGLAADVRVGDRVCRATASDRELVVVVLPDTGAQGAATFVSRLVTHAQRHLAAEGLAFAGGMRAESLSHPDDLEEMERLQRRLEVLDGAEALIRDVAVRQQRRAWPAGDSAMPAPTPELSGTRRE